MREAVRARLLTLTMSRPAPTNSYYESPSTYLLRMTPFSPFSPFSLTPSCAAAHHHYSPRANPNPNPNQVLTRALSSALRSTSGSVGTLLYQHCAMRLVSSCPP